MDRSLRFQPAASLVPPRSTAVQWPTIVTGCSPSTAAATRVAGGNCSGSFSQGRVDAPPTPTGHPRFAIPQFGNLLVDRRRWRRSSLRLPFCWKTGVPQASKLFVYVFSYDDSLGGKPDAIPVSRFEHRQGIQFEGSITLEVLCRPIGGMGLA